MAKQRGRQLEFGGIRIGEAADVEAHPIDAETPFRILVMGDFSGRGAGHPGDAARLATSRPTVIDRDNFAEVFARLNVRLPSLLVAQDAGETSLAFGELEDFEPDRLLEHVDLFAALRSVRQRLFDPASFPDAAAEVRSWQPPNVPTKPESVPPAAKTDPGEPKPGEVPPPDVDLGDLLDAAVAETRQSPAIDLAQGIIDIDRLVGEVVAPYVLDKPDPAQAELVACVDALSAQLLRSLLHHPRFQALEAAWRGLEFLVRRLETDATLKIYLWDISPADVVADLAAAEGLTHSGIYKCLVEQTVGTPGGVPWGLVVGNYLFDATEDDALLAGCLATVAAAARAPFVAAASPHLFGCDSLATAADPDGWRRSIDVAAQRTWSDVRELPVASSFGLVAPRFLLRAPYGPQSVSIDAFAFDEMPTMEHDAYLWGNGAFAVATLVGLSFVNRGWNLRPGMAIELEGLPLHIYEQDGERTAKACSEAVLTERALESIAAAGVMPLASLRDQDKVRLMRFCSLASDGSPLRGRWDD